MRNDLDKQSIRNLKHSIRTRGDEAGRVVNSGAYGA
jgi:hypothetical protein